MALLTCRVLGLIPRLLHWGGLGWDWEILIHSHFPGTDFAAVTTAAAGGGDPDAICG